MTLYLVQHGKNLPKEDDPSQPLSSTGREETQRMAEVARGYAVPVRRIEHSPKERAGETAAILAAFLEPEDGCAERQGIKALDEVAPIAEEVRTRDKLMLVGHLPFLERLAALLITGTQEPKVLTFQNSGIVCLDQDPETSLWSIQWCLMPRIGG
jgi:phosphohistidine phosphatase